MQFVYLDTYLFNYIFFRVFLYRNKHNSLEKNLCIVFKIFITVKDYDTNKTIKVKDYNTNYYMDCLNKLKTL